MAAATVLLTAMRFGFGHALFLPEEIWVTKIAASLRNFDYQIG